MSVVCPFISTVSCHHSYAINLCNQIFSIIPKRPDLSRHFPYMYRFIQKLLFTNADGKVYWGQFCPN